MTRRRPNRHPEYIQLQPYRALVGMPMERSRSGTISAFVGGAIKGMLVSVIPVSAAMFAIGHYLQGWSDLETAVANEGALTAIVVGGIAFLWGAISAARR